MSQISYTLCFFSGILVIVEPHRCLANIYMKPSTPRRTLTVLECGSLLSVLSVRASSLIMYVLGCFRTLSFILLMRFLIALTLPRFLPRTTPWSLHKMPLSLSLSLQTPPMAAGVLLPKLPLLSKRMMMDLFMRLSMPFASWHPTHVGGGWDFLQQTITLRLWVTFLFISAS